MFRSLGGTIEKKIKKLSKSSEVSEKLNRAFTRFLDECFTEGKNLDFEVSFLNTNIIIRTPNKAVANEILLKMTELSRILKEENIVSSQVIIS